MGGTSSIFDDEIKNVVDVKGLSSNSASPSDTWIVTYEKDGKRSQLFWKMFLNSLDNENNKPSIEEQLLTFL